MCLNQEEDAFFCKKIHGCAPKKMNDYILGLVSISFRKHTPEEIIMAVKTAGLSCIEWGSDVHAPCRDMEKLHKIARLQREYGITCSSYGTYFRLGHTPMEELKDYIAAAKLLGTNILRLWCGDKSGADMTEQERDVLFAECRKAAEIAEASGVTLCMECHMRSFTERPEDTVALMEAVSSPAFRMYWQPFQWLDVAGSMAVAKAVAPYAEHIHVFNWQGSGKFPLSEAVEDWRRYLSVFDTPRTLLLEFMPDDRIETLSAEAEALKTIVGGM